MTNSLTIKEYAKLWKRLFAFLIDSILIVTPFGILSILIGLKANSLSSDAFNSAVDIVGKMGQISAFIALLYFTIMESSSKQATLGKMALGIVVTDLEGKRISFWRAIRRFIGKGLSLIIPLIIWSIYMYSVNPSGTISFLLLILLCGFFIVMPTFTKRKQALHDIMVGSLVLNKNNI